MIRPGEFTPLIPFDLVFDTDLGLIKLIQDKYRSPKFNQDVLNMDDDSIIDLLLKREAANPLSILMDYKENKNLLDDYYQEFHETEYYSILRKAKLTTGVGRYCFAFTEAMDICPVIYIRNEYEEMLVASITEGISKDAWYTMSYVGDVKREAYKLDPIFCKTGYDYKELGMDFLQGHVVYLARYGFNVTEKEGKEYLSADIGNTTLLRSTVKMVDVYKRKKEEDEDA